MFNYSKLLAVGIIALTGACSSSNGADGAGSGAAANNGSVGGNGAGANNGGSANGTNGGTGNGGAANGTDGGSGNTTVGGDGNVGGAGTAGSGNTVCGTALCASATACGSITDPCTGNLVECGFTNCPQVLCGVVTPNECYPCTATTCAAEGKNCGSISDGCGGVLDCGTCTDPECCGCAPTGTTGVPNVCSSGSTAGSGLPQVCIAGSQGCLCDSRGGCAPGLTCNTARNPTVCCSGTNCDLPANVPTVATCSGTGTARCTPGITIPTASGTTDNCGYPSTSFKENAFICGINATGGGAAPGQVQAFFNDEMSTTLGCTQNGYTVTPMQSNPAYAFYPNTGDPACVDVNGRPMRPSLFITDITNDPNCKAGDQQQGGKPYDPVAVYGTWKAATNGTPDANPTAFNYWDLGTNADPVPAAIAAKCPCQPPPAGVPLPSSSGYNGGNVAAYNNCPGTSGQAKGFGTEAEYEAALVSGHSYRLQIIGHDGDQTQGGDSGEACVTFCAGTGVCVPLTCLDYPATAIGQQSDGCGGLTPPCNTCKPATCEQLCPPVTGSTPLCSSVGDNVVYAISCPKSDNCGGTVNCYCKIG